MALPSPTPRRVRRPSWLDLRLALGVALVLAAVVAGATVVSGARHTVARVAAARDLDVGTTLTAGDLTSVHVTLGSSDRAYATDASVLLGTVLNRPLRRGELVPVAAVGRVSARVTVSVPFASGAAPRLARGQRIVVWVSTTACPSVVLLPDVTVQDVRSDGGGFGAGAGGQDVVVSVPPALAARVAEALGVTDVLFRAGVLTGSTGPLTAGALPDLSVCEA